MRNPTGSRLPTGLIAVLLATSSTTLFASGVDQRAPRDLVEQVVFDARHNTASSVKARIRPRSGDTPLQTSIEFVARHRELFRLRDPSTELRLYKTETDNLGYTHLRLNQQYRNIPVWGCQKVAHFDAAGELYMVAGQSIPTPHLDTLAASGVRFSSGYVSGTWCSPTRAGLLTGRHQERWGHEQAQHALSLSEVTIADRLKAAGYATGIV